MKKALSFLLQTKWSLLDIVPLSVHTNQQTMHEFLHSVGKEFLPLKMPLLLCKDAGDKVQATGSVGQNPELFLAVLDFTTRVLPVLGENRSLAPAVSSQFTVPSYRV